MIGMVAFIADIPENLAEPASVFAVQIYTWSSNPDNAMIEKTSALISVLLLLLLCLNIAAHITKRLLNKDYL